MLTAGDEFLAGPGETPPRPPAGFHWQISNVIFSDTGGATLYTLVADDAGASAWTSDLQNQFTQGFLSFFQSLGLTSGVGGAGAFGGDARPLTFQNAGDLTAMKWKADKDYVIVGCALPSGWNIAIALVDVGTGLATERILDGVLVATTTTTQGNIGGLPRMVLKKDSTLFVRFGQANGSCTIYLQPI
jgi:hypothetical protein